MSEPPVLDPIPPDELVPEDDTVISVAFRRSLILLTVMAVLGGLAFWLARRPEPPGPERKIPVIVPQAPATARELPRVPFTDITEPAGLDFVRVSGAYGEKLLPEAMGGGAAFFDYDRDGDQDLLLINGDYWPQAQPLGLPNPTAALYRNDGSGHFADVSAATGLDLTFYGTGIAVGDYDNDGDVDVFFSALGKDRLLRNEGGRFRDVTAAAGVAGGDGDWGTSAAFLDYDRDGDLDLFVANYVRWTRSLDMWLDYRLEGAARSFGPPENYEGSDPFLYRNNGDGTFTEVGAASGLRVHEAGVPIGKSLGLAPADVDGDGWIDLLVTNNMVRNFFFHNRGDGTFKEEALRFGLAYDRFGRAAGWTGADCGRYGRGFAFLVGNAGGSGMSSLFVTAASGPPSFADASLHEGLGASTRQPLSFGAFLFDADLDGRLDAFHANGHLEDEIQRIQSLEHYEQPAQLHWNTGSETQTFVELPAARTGDLSYPLVGRGAAYADIDGDGDLDVVITQAEGAARLLRNDQQLGHHWLRLKLAGAAVNRDAIGARVQVTAGGATQERQVMPARSYLSQVELPLTFGLGSAGRVEAVRVIWSDGSIQNVPRVEVDRLQVIEQGRPAGRLAP